MTDITTAQSDLADTTDTESSPPEEAPLSTTSTSFATDIAAWLAEGTSESAARLEALATATGSKDVRKAARRALYLLSQRGIVAPSEARRIEASPVDVGRGETLRAWASAYDGAGNQLFLVVLTPSGGGSATIAQILANDELGIRDLTLERRRSREVAPLMERLVARADEGLAVAEIEPDHARHAIDRFRRINQQRCKTTPSGFLDLLPRIGPPASEDEPPADFGLDAGDGIVSSDPADLFKLPWFEPWFFAVEDVTPWLAHWMEVNEGVVVTSEKVREERKSAVAREAASVLLTDHLRGLYVTRLEESAGVLRRLGRTTEARQALLHAQALRSDRATGEIPFAVALAARTLEAAAEMVAAARREQAGTGARESK